MQFRLNENASGVGGADAERPIYQEEYEFL